MKELKEINDSSISQKSKRFLLAVLSTHKSKYRLSQEVELFSESKFTNIKGGKNEVTDDMIKALMNYDNDIDGDWILTGKETMRFSERGQIESNIDYLKKRFELKNAKEYIVPIYDAGVTAGNEYLNVETAVTEPIGYISVGQSFSDAKAALRVYGNSMLAGYPPGCIIALAPLTENIIQPGEVYVIETDQQRIFKRVFFKDDDPGSDILHCFSDNTMTFETGARKGMLAYPSFYIQRNAVRQINTVLGVIKRNTNALIK